jgi:subtilisin-like proprotein convertase family protein
MKKPLMLTLLLSSGALSLTAAVTEVFPYVGVNQLIPDGNASGMCLTYDIASTITSIDSVRVSLDISSDSNGSLYAYLVHDGAISVLLNRSGRTAANLAGYDDYGFDITLDDSLINRDIHVYNTIQSPTPGSKLTGLWQSDGRNLDPDAVLDSTSRDATLNSLGSKDANGTWRLYFASLESGGTTTLNGWSLEVTGVPEPMAWGYGTGLLLLGFAGWRKLR